MVFVESDELLGTSPDANDKTSLHQPQNGHLDRTKMLPCSPSKFANRHGFACLLQHAECPYLALRTQNLIPGGL